MHDTAFHIGTLAMNIYADLQSASILEVGSHAVNGSLRDNALPTTRYVGVDINAGDGVDLVVELGKPLPVDDSAFDLVVASSVFEHDPCFWVTFLEMCRAAKDGGYIYLNAPSNGVVHRYPQDNWRFYPDSGKALAQWAISQGFSITLMESFIANRENDVWNDFVAVFRKGRITRALPKVFIHEHVSCSNVVTWNSKEIINPIDQPQDLVLLNDANLRAESAEAALSKAHEERDLMTQENARLSAQLHEEEELRRRQLAEWDELQGRLAEADKIRNTLELKDSELRQRQEEIEQTRAELAMVQLERNEVRAHFVETERRLDLEERLRSQAESILAQWKDLYEGEQLRANELAAEQKRLSQERGDLERRLTQSEAQRERVLRKAEMDRRAAEVDLERKLRKAEAQAERVLRKAEDDRQLFEAGRNKAEAATRESEAKLNERFQELATLSNLLRQEEKNHEVVLQHLEWMVALYERISSQPRWWLIMPKTWRRQRVYRRLQRSGLFDSTGYLERYRDVADAGMDPLDHYLRHGIREGRARLS